MKQVTVELVFEYVQIRERVLGAEKPPGEKKNLSARHCRTKTKSVYASVVKNSFAFFHSLSFKLLSKLL